MTIKEKLESLEYSEVYDLWINHVHQLAEPPKLWDLINQLSDLAGVDADTKAAILSDIAILGKEDETSDNKLKLTCCNSPITLEELPANYGHQFIGRCDKCGNTYGIEDITEISDEFGEEAVFQE